VSQRRARRLADILAAVAAGTLRQVKRRPPCPPICGFGAGPGRVDVRYGTAKSPRARTSLCENLVVTESCSVSSPAAIGCEAPDRHFGVPTLPEPVRARAPTLIKAIPAFGERWPVSHVAISLRFISLPWYLAG